MIRKTQPMLAPKAQGALVLYLDFDGVLHPADVVRHARRDSPGRAARALPREIALGRASQAAHALFENAGLLEQALAPYPQVRIVLSTSWVPTLGFERALRFLPAGLVARTAGATWHTRMAEDLPPAARWERFARIPRGQQVLADVHRRGPAAWVALDDDPDGWGEARAHLVATDPEHGLGHTEVYANLVSLLARTFLTR